MNNIAQHHCHLLMSCLVMVTFVSLLWNKHAMSNKVCPNFVTTVPGEYDIIGVLTLQKTAGL